MVKSWGRLFGNCWTQLMGWAYHTLWTLNIFLRITVCLCIPSSIFLQSDTITDNLWTLTCHNVILVRVLFLNLLVWVLCRHWQSLAAGNTLIKWRTCWGFSLTLVMCFPEPVETPLIQQDILVKDPPTGCWQSSWAQGSWLSWDTYRQIKH